MLRGALLTLACGGCFTKPPAPGEDLGGNGVAPNIAFVTSDARPVTQITGLIYADQWCMEAAANAGLEGTFRAWMSTSSTNAKDRFGDARGWVRVDGKPFADSIDALVTERRMYYPLRIDENGDDVLPGDPFSIMKPVATGTTEQGVLDTNVGNEPQDCQGWTGTRYFRSGYADAAGSAWTAATLTKCDATVTARIYCLGADRASRVDPVRPTARRIFVTEDTVTANLGVDGFDRRCDDEAVAANLSGTFRAVVATSLQPAIARLGVPDRPWTRIDGVQATTTFTAFDAPITVSARGVYVADSHVWTGSSDPALPSMETCADWSSSSFDESARAAWVERTRSDNFGGTLARCDSLTPTRLFCAESP